MTRNRRSSPSAARRAALAAIAMVSVMTAGRPAAANQPSPPAMYIQGCNLGCSTGAGGSQVSCTIVSIARNQPIRVQFTHPVDLLSVNGSTFQILDVGSGQIPTGSYSLDPSSPDTVVFEPSLSFDSFGNPIFGFEPNRTYRINIPGASQGDPPPYITSSDLPHLPNRSRMHCNVLTSTDVLSPGVAFCAGDGVDPVVTTPCPCSNFGAAGLGCANSTPGSPGARLFALGSSSPDTAKLYSTYMPASALTVFFQGSQSIASGVAFGDGIRCVSGTLVRLGVASATSGISMYPRPSDPSITVRSAARGDPITPGAIRVYQTWYRDDDPAFCPSPAGGVWNVTNGVRITW